jgi:translation initiation factor 2B subunit (eIF-2B alpha/beta/delta family)
MRRPLVAEITSDAGYGQALELVDAFERAIADSANLGPDLDDETREAILKGYRLHLADLECRIGEYEARRRSVRKEEGVRHWGHATGARATGPRHRKLAPPELRRMFPGLTAPAARRCSRAYGLVADQVASLGTAEPSYTVHDARHVQNVLCILSRLLEAAPRSWCGPDVMEQLIIGAIVHDVGMVCGPRSQHHRAGARWIADTNRRQEPGIAAPELQRIQCFATHHSSYADLNELGAYPGLSELVALVRLADALDVGPDRAPLEEFLRIVEAGRHDDQRRLHWTVSRTVELVDPQQLSGRNPHIRLIPWYPDPMLLCVPDFVRRHLQSELDSIRAHAPRWLQCREVVFAKGHKANPLAWYGWEAYALEAAATLHCTLKQEVLFSSGLVEFLLGAVQVLARGREPSEPLTQAVHLARKLNVYHPYLNNLRHLRWLVESSAEAGCPAGLLRDSCRDFRLYREQAVTELSAQAEVALGSYRSFLAFGFGAPVAATLERLSGTKNAERKVVISPLMRPVGEGRTPQAYASRTRFRPMPVEVIPDEQIMHKMQEVDAVLMGCHAILSDGAILSSSGALLTALAAQHFHRPVYVITESLELPLRDDRFPLHLSKVGPSAFVHDPAEQAILTKERYPVAEEVPAELITGGIITEFGISSGRGATGRIAKEARKRWPESLRPSVQVTRSRQLTGPSNRARRRASTSPKPL